MARAIAEPGCDRIASSAALSCTSPSVMVMTSSGTSAVPPRKPVAFAALIGSKRAAAASSKAAAANVGLSNSRTTSRNLSRIALESKPML